MARSDKLRAIDAPRPQPPAYPPLTAVPIDIVRDAATLQSQRALELARAAGLEIPDAHH